MLDKTLQHIGQRLHGSLHDVIKRGYITGRVVARLTVHQGLFLCFVLTTDWVTVTYNAMTPDYV